MNQWRKGIARWQVGDVMYMSIPFTWLLPEAEAIAKAHKGKVVVGGPAVLLLGAGDWAEAPGSVPFDTLSFHNPLATFTSRGCPNLCPFCAVPKIEGDFRELTNWKPAPVICDNNILASSRFHFRKVIDSLTVFPYVDFNQGLDARLFTKWRAQEIARLKACKVRFSFDSLWQESQVADAIRLCRKVGLNDLGVYCLIGFNDTPREAWYRLEKVREWGIRPTPMRYQPVDARIKNCYVAPPWREGDLRKTMQYYSRLRWYEHIPFQDFERFPFAEQDWLFGGKITQPMEANDENPRH